MKKTKSPHVVMRNSKMFCSHCGEDQIVPYPLHMDMFSAMSAVFIKRHKDCKKTWKWPIADMSESMINRQLWWLEYGERGASSETIFSHLDIYNLLNRLYKDSVHPQDPSDFHRCYKLLQTIPEWKQELYKIKNLSPIWNRLIDNWDKLTYLLEEQIKTNKENGMAELMDKLINEDK